MDRLRRTMMWLIASGLIAGALSLVYLQNWMGRERAALGVWQNVVVASHQVKAGAVLTAGDLQVTQVPVRFKPVGAVAKPDQLLGLRIRIGLPAGAYIRSTDVDDAVTSAPGMRSLIIDPSDRVHVSAVQPGAYVDIFGAWGSDQKAETGAVALRLRVTAASAQGQRGQSVTVLVPVDQLARLLQHIASDKQLWVLYAPDGGVDGG